MWFMVLCFFIGGKIEYEPYGRPFNSWEECDAIIDHSNDNIHSSTQCFEKDVLITLLKHQ